MNKDGIISRYKTLPRTAKLGIWLGTALVTYAMIGFLLVPLVTKYVLGKNVANALHRPVHVDKVYFNPFTLDMQITGLEIGARGDGKQLAAVRQLEVNLQAISLFKQALVLSAIRIAGPRIYISQDRKGRFNFQDILEGGSAKGSEEETGQFMFSLNNIQINDGSVTFKDERRGVTHKITGLKAGIPFISNLKTRVRIYTKPYFSAVVNGAPVEFKGQTRPFARDHSTMLHVRLRELDLAHYLAYVSDFVRFKIDSGTLNTDLDVIFAVKKDGTQDVELDGNMTVSRVSLSKRGRPLFRLGSITFEFDPSNVLKKQIWFSRIHIERPWMEITRDAGGNLNLVDLLVEGRKKQAGKHEEKTGSTPETSPIDIRIQRADLAGGSVHFRDSSAGNGTFDTTLDSVNVLLEDFGTLEKKPARVHLSLNTGKGGTCKLDGHVGLMPVSANIKAVLGSLNLPAYSPYYQQFLNATLSGGKADISADLGLESREKGAPAIRIQDISLGVSDLVFKDKSTGSSSTPMVHLAHLGLSGGEVDIPGRDIHIESVSVNGISSRLEIDKSGVVNLAKIARGSGDDKSGPQASQQDAFHFSLGSLSVKKAACSFRDFSGERLVQLAIGDMGLDLRGLDTSPEKRCTFRLWAGIGKRGRVNISGSTDINLKKLDASYKIKRLGLRQLQGYISRFSNAVIYRGSLGFKGKIHVASPMPGEFKLTTMGSGGLYGVSILDPRNRKPLFHWKKVALKGLLFHNDPLKLHIKEVLLDRLAGNIVFDEKGDLNVLALLKEEKGTSAGKETKETGKTRQDIRIRLLNLRNCAVSFVDNSVKPPFKRSIDQINGQIKGISSDSQMRAEIEIKGLADNSATMELKGLINPLAKPVYADLTLTTKGIGMTRFSPYTAKFLGYVIDKGKLSNQVHIVIQDDKVTAQNRLFLDQFDFGHSVQSEDAVHLPVKLAIALLKDRQGKINVDIPVHGRLDDPEFSLGGAILSAIINIFVKAATSPFSLLSAIAGGGEDLQKIVFEPGSSRLDDEGTRKLKELAKALKDRPALKVELTGYYDSEPDTKGLRELRFMRLLRKEKMKDLDDEERQKIVSVDDVEIKPEEFNKYLTKAYKEAPFKKPRMIIGLLKKQPPEVMKKMLYDHIKIHEADLENLAMEREQAVHDFLVSQEGIEPERIFLTSVRHAEAGKGEKGSMVKLSLK